MVSNWGRGGLSDSPGLSRTQALVGGGGGTWVEDVGGQ